ncbi:MAG: DUF4062 domain-containing protein [Armatimonadota bacterium]|nr:DUF4062 domain-containing protein [Armatimonadota bacterium]
MGKPIVFISSTSDLSQERQALAETLRRLRLYEPYLYEEDRARGGSPEAHVRQMIEASDVFVGVLGARYGSLFSAGPPQRSIVEWEFDEASARRHIQIMMFIREMPAGEVIEPPQQHFLDRVRDFHSGVWCRFFSSANELSALVRESLELWLLEVWQRVQKESQRRTVPWLHRILSVVAVAFVGLLCLIAATPLRAQFSNSALIALCAVSATVVLLCIVLLQLEMGGQYGREQ